MNIFYPIAMLFYSLVKLRSFNVFPSPWKQDVEQWVQNVLPSRGFGHIVLTTTYGILTHEEARQRKTGGKILGFFY
jgi:ribosomal protein S8